MASSLGSSGFGFSFASRQPWSNRSGQGFISQTSSFQLGVVHTPKADWGFGGGGSSSGSSDWGFGGGSSSTSGSGGGGGGDWGFGGGGGDSGKDKKDDKNKKNSGTQNQSGGSDWGFGGGSSGGGSSDWGFGGFGDSKSSSQSSQAAQQQQQSSSAQSRIRRGVQEIEDAYSPASQVCRLQALMYNRVPYNLRANYLKKRENVDPRLWEQAEKNNPDPINLVPFHVAGFDQLEKRLQQQDGAMITYDEQLQLAREQIAQMQAQHDLQLKIEIPRLKKQLADISHRLLVVLSNIDCRRSEGVRFLPDEVEYSRKLQAVSKQLANPAQFHGRMRELLSVNIPAVLGRGAGGEAGMQLDEEATQRIAEFLDVQRRALQILSNQLKRDLKDADTVLNSAVL